MSLVLLYSWHLNSPTKSLCVCHRFILIVMLYVGCRPFWRLHFVEPKNDYYKMLFHIWVIKYSPSISTKCYKHLGDTFSTKWFAKNLCKMQKALPCSSTFELNSLKISTTCSRQNAMADSPQINQTSLQNKTFKCQGCSVKFVKKYD